MVGGEIRDVTPTCRYMYKWSAVRPMGATCGALVRWPNTWLKLTLLSGYYDRLQALLRLICVCSRIVRRVSTLHSSLNDRTWRMH
eukprot:7885204-Pyramimonas_sp.AAC.1